MQKATFLTVSGNFLIESTGMLVRKTTVVTDCGNSLIESAGMLV